MTHEFIILKDHRKEKVNKHENIHTIIIEYPNIDDNEDSNEWNVCGFLSIYEGDSFIESLDVHLTHDLITSFQNELFSLNDKRNLNLFLSHIMLLLWNSHKLLPIDNLNVKLFSDKITEMIYNKDNYE
jgi:hypothetical protein